jgi:hypothetical protein
MKFIFHGDSWFWTWGYDVPSLKHTQIRSKAITEWFTPNVYCYRPEEVIGCISFIEMFLERLGHTVEHTNVPGNPFATSISAAIECEPEPNAVQLIFFSSPFRGEEMKEVLEREPWTNMAQVDEVVDAETVKQLNRLGAHANATNQKYFISGGQSTLFRHVFDRVEPELRKNLTLLHECILTRISPIGVGFGRYKFADFVGPEFNVNWEQVDPSIVDEIHKQLSTMDTMGRPYTFPDTAHMNVLTTLYFIDDLMCAVEGELPLRQQWQ